jgi:hypothetical protein
MFWTNTNQCWIVNGFIEKADGNFKNEFFFTNIENTGIYIGSYIETEK